MMKDVIKEYKDDLNNFKKLIGFANNDIDKFNKELISKINSKIDEKRKRVSNLHTLRQKMSIDIKKRPDAPNFKPIQVVKKTKPLSTKLTKENEYYIPEEDYEEILRRIRHSGSSMERIPSTYSTMSEEQLRDIIVSQLNVDYEGMVQGESFRNKGKTDICIEYNNRAAFVTECKIWKGKNTLSKTIMADRINFKKITP